MEEAQKLLNQPTWRIIDQSSTGLHMSALHSFGYDDTLCASIGTKGAPATVRAWVHADTIVLGIQDTRLPYISDGLQYLKGRNYEYIVRNSGGLAVVLDEEFSIYQLFSQNRKRELISIADTMRCGRLFKRCLLILNARLRLEKL